MTVEVKSVSEMPPRQLSCGLDFCSVPDIRSSLTVASEAGYNFVCFPIVHPRFKREFIGGKCKGRDGPFTRSDLILPGSDWNTLIVGKISSYIDVDCLVPAQRKQYEAAFIQELQYASHLCLPAVMVSLHGLNITNLARLLNNKIQSNCSYQIWVHVPMECPSVGSKNYYLNENDGSEKEDVLKPCTWNWWRKFHSLANWESKLGLALEITSDIPTEEEIIRWMGEPIKCILISTAVFITNKSGYPVLSRAHQALVKTLASLDVQVVIKGAIRHGQIKYYQQYLEHLWQNPLHSDPLQAFARGYEDYLQCPLQPLMDNLESQTYEVFEKDPVKYNEYQRAIYCALLDRVPFEEKENAVQVVMVVGAGRGPLVRASLNAAQKADRKIRIYAVEKNPNAVVTLQAQQKEVWGDQVTVVSCDMRDWKAPEKADILISELLGSFGDNELSPECLDGAQSFLKDDGISIPCSYTSYLCPVQSSKLYSEVRLCKEKDKHPLHPFESPYVVHLQNKFQLSPPQTLFSFHHPNRDEIIDNTRYECRSYKVNQDAVLHGFSGYFETVLYKNITLSILPETYTKGMFSWFPIFFPIREPVHVKGGDTLEVHFWRCISKKGVWYEWCVTQPVPGPIHNPNGRSYIIGL
ncbi:hypothetical protein R5R35_013873 [Gryllus longicercus]|uniref:Protein arginine N-methyltransferase n=2 Tax=Gryllus longicercus TaxID=2509291 RepID=A0AAN9W3K4_9ORTH